MESDAEWCITWDLNGTSQYLVNRGYSRVALQFPDDLLDDATTVAAALQGQCAASGHLILPFVLADTSYHSLGVDEVAAAHADAHCVVHLFPPSARERQLLASGFP